LRELSMRSMPQVRAPPRTGPPAGVRRRSAPSCGRISIAGSWSGTSRRSVTSRNASGNTPDPSPSGSCSRPTSRCASSRTRPHGTKPHRRRVAFLGCLSHWKRGSEVCSNGRLVRLEVADEAVLAALVKDTDPTVIRKLVAWLFDQLTPQHQAETTAKLTRDLRSVDAKIATLTSAIEAGGAALPSLIARLSRTRGGYPSRTRGGGATVGGGWPSGVAREFARAADLHAHGDGVSLHGTNDDWCADRRSRE
jgi:hypothetical protein